MFRVGERCGRSEPMEMKPAPSSRIIGIEYTDRMDTMIEYHDPRGETDIEQFPYTLSSKIRGSNKITIGLLANGFPDSENFLDHIAEVIKENEPGVTIESFNKGNASIPANDDILAQLSECQAVITAYGH